MRERVAELLRIVPANVGIKAKTPEGLDADNVAQAHAVVLLERIEDADDLQTMTAVMQSQRELEDVVRNLVSQVHGVPVKAPFDTEDIT
jgi:2-C-methyl-D-erythritol 2,4-cyclodiphosphate synthase